ncbi:MAG: hypothetical protein FWE11_11000 [Defluviitaleaceae bacterium]|jgi:hypothetical protein|nr:hypothetical protein [Defluviitaleaceae bacterium]
MGWFIIISVLAVIVLVVVKRSKANNSDILRSYQERASPQPQMKPPAYPPHIAQAVAQATDERIRRASEYAFRVIENGGFARQDTRKTESFIRLYMELIEDSQSFRESILSSMTQEAVVISLICVPNLAFKSHGLVTAEYVNKQIEMIVSDNAVDNDTEEMDDAEYVRSMLIYLDPAQDYPQLEAENSQIPIEQTSWYSIVSKMEKDAKLFGWKGIY